MFFFLKGSREWLSFTLLSLAAPSDCPSKDLAFYLFVYLRCGTWEEGGMDSCVRPLVASGGLSVGKNSQKSALSLQKAPAYGWSKRCIYSKTAGKGFAVGRVIQ